MKRGKIKSWESSIYLLSPNISEKRLMIASMLYYSNTEIVSINDRELQLEIIGSENETVEGADDIYNHIMEKSAVKMYGDIDGAFRKVKNDNIQNSLSIQVSSVKYTHAAVDNSLCGRLKIIGITDNDVIKAVPLGNYTRTLVIMLDAKKIIDCDSSDLDFYMDALKKLIVRSLSIAVVTAIGHAEEYYHMYPEGDEIDLIMKARNLYPALFELIDNSRGYMKGVFIHREAVYAAANVNYSKLYGEDGNLSDNLEYEPWGISELIRKIVYCSAYVDVAMIDSAIKNNENVLLKRIGIFQRRNVRAHIDVTESRKRLSKYLIYRYPLDNSIKYFADTH